LDSLRTASPRIGLGSPMESQSFIKMVGEKDYQELVNFILHYIADMNIPIKR
jgi:phosphomannomutase